MLKSQTALVGEYTYISQADDAIDRPAELADDATDEERKAHAAAVAAFEQRWARYVEGAEDAPLKPDGKPTVFHLRHLKAKDVAALRRVDGGPEAMAYEAAKLAIKDVSGAKIPGWSAKSGVDEAPRDLYGVFVEVGMRAMTRTTPPGK